MGPCDSTNTVYGSQLDPRPDITYDTNLWGAVLAEALHNDPDLHEPASIFGLLHGLRCGGAQLHITEAGTIRLDYSALVTSGIWTNKELRSKWLMPAADGLKRVFGKVEPHVAGNIRTEPYLRAAAGL